MNMNVREILENITKKHASDIFVVAGRPLTYKVSGKMHTYQEERMKPDMCRDFVTAIYELADHRDISQFETTGDDDFSFAIVGVSRFRVSTYKQRGSYSAVIRIITLEDPLEYLHTHKKSIVSQREICTDTENYLTALRASLRQSPDVILLGEMRDYETINTAMTAAETGHLIFSTLHTIGAANTIDRIIDAFPAAQQHQVAVQLSMVLHAVVSQRLLPTTDGKMVPAFEIMVLTPAIRNIIREGKTHQIDGMIYTSTNENMLAMDTSIFRLYQKGIIDKKTALANASNPEMMSKKIGAI